jgi:hypothetical protein
MSTSAARRRAVIAVMIAAVTGASTAAPASARTMPLNIDARKLIVPTSFSCPDPVKPLLCNVGASGEITSNLAHGPGTVEYFLVIDFSPAFGAPCNVVDETAVFTFDTGTLTTHSYHQDCPATVRPGPRIQTQFTILGGTGAFAGATGGGTEIGPPVYHGTIDF